MPCCPCPISKSNQKIFTLIDKREAVTSTVDGTCTSMIWTAFVRNRETNINSAVVGVIIVFYFWRFLLIALLRKDFGLTIEISPWQRKVGYRYRFLRCWFRPKAGLLSSSAQTEHAKQNGLPWQSLPGNGIGKVDPVGRLYRQQELFCINKRHRWSLGFIFTRNHVISDEAIMVKIILIPQ